MVARAWLLSLTKLKQEVFKIICVDLGKGRTANYCKVKQQATVPKLLLSQAYTALGSLTLLASFSRRNVLYHRDADTPDSSPRSYGLHIHNGRDECTTVVDIDSEFIWLLAQPRQ